MLLKNNVVSKRELLALVLGTHPFYVWHDFFIEIAYLSDNQVIYFNQMAFSKRLSLGVVY